MNRNIVQTTKGVSATDGAGVKLTRIIASPELDMVDPLLMLDKFESDRPGDYIAGFPTHPHRGFETVTYMLAGRMRHKDNAGNEGVIEAGGVQWMKAAKGILHSEMPEQESGLMRGFQLWINLPAANKLDAPNYQEFAADEMPTETLDTGGAVLVITGTTDSGTTGPVLNTHTDPLYLDVSLNTAESFEQTVAQSHNAVIYVIDGGVVIDDMVLETNTLGVFGPGDKVSICAGPSGARVLLIAGRRLDEPVARGGPFVMNTRAEVLEAFADLRAGRF